MTAVSVVMGVFNGAENLSESIDSVLRQCGVDLELIVVNDGSTDTLVEAILSHYQQSDKRIRFVNKQNEGLTKALVDGCRLARGNLVARVDSGDVMLPGRLAAQAAVLNKYQDCAFVSCWTEFCGPSWEPMWIAKGSPASEKPDCVLPDNPSLGLQADIPHHGSVMFRRSDYERSGGYRPEFYFGQDWDLWYRLAELGHYQVVPQLLYRARFSPASISMVHKRFQDECARCSKGAFIARMAGSDELPWLQQARKARPSPERKQDKSQVSLEPGYYFIGEALRRRGDSRARIYLAQAIRYSPGSARAYIRWLQCWSLGKNSRS